MNRHFTLLLELTRKDIKTRYFDSFSGLAWLIIQPMLLLLIYSFVFVIIFKARVPEADLTGFVPYLAIAFWPWTAFSESILRSADSVTENSEIIGKIALPAEVFPGAAVTSTFVMHMIGYLAVLIVLQATGTAIQWLYLPLAVLLMGVLFVAALSLGLLISSISVFVRDLKHALPALMMLWFFSTPILYSISLIPERYRYLLALNPFYYFSSTIREMLLAGTWRPGMKDALAIFLVLVSFGIAVAFFRRVRPRFEDFF